MQEKLTYLQFLNDKCLKNKKKFYHYIKLSFKTKKYEQKTTNARLLK